MLVFCEECGKRYSFPPEETEPGSNQFRCRECNFLMTIGLLDKEHQEEQDDDNRDRATAHPAPDPPTAED